VEFRWIGHDRGVKRVAQLLLVLAALSALAGPAAARRRGRVGRRAAATARRAPRIDLDVVRADLRDVLRLLADVGRVGIVIDEAVGRGEISVSLRGIRWDRALRAILHSKGLGMVREGRTVRVATRATLAAERASRLRQRRRCRDHGPLVTRLVRLSYARAAALAPLLRGMLRSARGSVIVDERTNTLIVRDVRCRR